MALWFYKSWSDQSDEFGPVEFEALAELVRDGILTGESKVRRADGTLWIPVCRVRGLRFDDLFQAPKPSVAPDAGSSETPEAVESSQRDTSAVWERALGLAAGALNQPVEAVEPRTAPSRRWRVRRPRPPRIRLLRTRWWWRLGESLTAAVLAALVVAYICNWYLDQPERYPIPRRLQHQFGEGARFLFGTGPWSPNDVFLISLNLTLLAAVMAGVVCHFMPRDRSAG